MSGYTAILPDPTSGCDVIEALRHLVWKKTHLLHPVETHLTLDEVATFIAMKCPSLILCGAWHPSRIEG